MDFRDRIVNMVVVLCYPVALFVVLMCLFTAYLLLDEYLYLQEIDFHDGIVDLVVEWVEDAIDILIYPVVLFVVLVCLFPLYLSLDEYLYTHADPLYSWLDKYIYLHSEDSDWDEDDEKCHLPLKNGAKDKDI